MYYGLLARFSAAVEFLSPRLLRVGVGIAVAVLLIVGLAFSLLLAEVAGLALFGLFALWMADRWVHRQQRGAGLR